MQHWPCSLLAGALFKTFSMAAVLPERQLALPAILLVPVSQPMCGVHRSPAGSHVCPPCRPANDLQLMSYRSYLDSFLLPFESGRSPETQQRNTERKAERQARKRTFTEPGQPGHMFRCGAVSWLCPSSSSRVQKLDCGAGTGVRRAGLASSRLQCVCDMQRARFGVNPVHAAQGRI